MSEKPPEIVRAREMCFLPGVGHAILEYPARMSATSFREFEQWTRLIRQKLRKRRQAVIAVNSSSVEIANG